MEDPFAKFRELGLRVARSMQKVNRVHRQVVRGNRTMEEARLYADALREAHAACADLRRFYMSQVREVDGIDQQVVTAFDSLKQDVARGRTNAAFPPPPGERHILPFD